MYNVLQQLAGDVSGGSNNLILETDQRWMNIVSVMEMLFTGDTTTTEVAFHLIADRPEGARYRNRAYGTALFLATLNDEGLFSWNPPLLVDAHSIQSTIQNINGSIHNLTTTIYCFRKRALEETPLNVLLASLPSVQFTNVVS